MNPRLARSGMLLTSEVTEALIARAEAALEPVWTALQAQALFNQRKVLMAFGAHRIGEEHFPGTTGYGHGDLGREALESLIATIFGAPAALVSHRFASGTHAIATALFGALSPGDELLYVTGAPYDTLEEVIGLRGTGAGSLLEWGVRYRQVELAADRLDTVGILAALSAQTRVVALQRSRGYAWRPSIAIEELAATLQAIKAVRPDIICFVDNCYGEFTQRQEPTEVGADLIAGSLIKNPGGGIVPSGGYVAGRADLVHRAACRLNAPGIGQEGGASEGHRLLFQGLFMAPHVVAEAVRGATLAAQIFADLGFQVNPLPGDLRTDIIQAIRLEDPDLLVALCRGIQEASPINAHVEPVPDVVPGYGDQVVMAAGTFIEGSTLELSADGPLRPPYVAYLQGGLNYAHCRLALAHCLERMRESGAWVPSCEEALR